VGRLFLTYAWVLTEMLHTLPYRARAFESIDWRVSIIGSQANDQWEMKIIGPNAFANALTGDLHLMCRGLRMQSRHERAMNVAVLGLEFYVIGS